MVINETAICYVPLYGSSKLNTFKSVTFYVLCVKTTSIYEFQNERKCLQVVITGWLWVSYIRPMQDSTAHSFDVRLGVPEAHACNSCEVSAVHSFSIQLNLFNLHLVKWCHNYSRPPHPLTEDSRAIAKYARCIAILSACLSALCNVSMVQDGSCKALFLTPVLRHS